jgi:hypothetical protein
MSISVRTQPQTYDHIVSLGSNCQTAENLRRFFNFGTAYPFDWWVSPLSSIIAYMESGFDSDELFDPENLIPVCDAGGAIESIKSYSFDVSLHHEFQRDASQHILQNWKSGVPNAKARHNMLLSRLRRVFKSDRPIVFFRSFRNKDDPRELDRLYDLLRSSYSGPDLRFVTINYLSAPVNADRISVDDNDATDWTGDHEKWNVALASLGIVLGSHQKPYNERASMAERYGSIPIAPHLSEK